MDFTGPVAPQNTAAGELATERMAYLYGNGKALVAADKVTLADATKFRALVEDFYTHEYKYWKKEHGMLSLSRPGKFLEIPLPPFEFINFGDGEINGPGVIEGMFYFVAIMSGPFPLPDETPPFNVDDEIAARFFYWLGTTYPSTRLYYSVKDAYTEAESTTDKNVYDHWEFDPNRDPLLLPLRIPRRLVPPPTVGRP